jgi:DNA-binding CsgD family transcriptional regulator
MADRRLSILVALADRERAEDLVVHLAEEHGMVATLAGALDLEDHAYDAVLSSEPIDDGTPHVILDDLLPSGDPTGNIFAVLPTSSGDALIAAALRLAAAGYRVAPAVPSPPAGSAPGTAIVLTQREKQVVALLAEGASNKLIARRLGISVHTAKFHVAAILQKLGAVNRTDAIAIAMREGLILV